MAILGGPFQAVLGGVDELVVLESLFGLLIHWCWFPFWLAAVSALRELVCANARRRTLSLSVVKHFCAEKGVTGPIQTCTLSFTRILKEIYLSRYYRPELDGLRFFAFLCVFCFHRMDYVPLDPSRNPWLFKFSTAGSFGVPVFFLLSAFLITELLMREREATGTVHVKAFYVRRILRIWPLYFAAFFGLAVLNHFLPGVGPVTHSSWLAFSLFAGNWYIVKHGWIAGPVDPLWSISVEEQFYIVIPLVIAFAGRRGVRIASYLLLAIAYLVIVRYALHPTTGDNGEWTDSFVHFQFFCAGTLLALSLHGRLPRLPVLARLSGFVLGFACWFLCLRLGVQSWEPHAGVAESIAGWALMLLGAILFFVSTLGTPERFIPRGLAYLGAHLLRSVYLPHANLVLRIEKGGAWLHEDGSGDAPARWSTREHWHRTGASSYISGCTSVVQVLRAAFPAPQRTFHVCSSARRGERQRLRGSGFPLSCSKLTASLANPYPGCEGAADSAQDSLR